jgi:hypothetical protein
MEAALWLFAPVVVLLGLYLFSRQSRRRRTNAEWEQLPTTAGYNPLQEIVEPATRHIAQVEEHSVDDDDQGSGD